METGCYENLFISVILSKSEKRNIKKKTMKINVKKETIAYICIEEGPIGPTPIIEALFI